MVIALVMRAAAQQSPQVSPQVWALKGMQGAYSFVKEKSPCVGPNMYLIYQLLDYEKKLTGESAESDDSAKEDEEWSRRRRELDEASSDEENEDLQSSAIMEEARALDKAMEDSIIARKSSASSISSLGSGIGMGQAWRSRYGSRKRTESIASSRTNTSIISEDLLEEDEEQALLGVGGGFESDSERERQDSFESNQESLSSASPDDADDDVNPQQRQPLTATAPVLVLSPPASAPIRRTSFHATPPPLTAIRSTFELPPPPSRGSKGAKKRPVSLTVMPPALPSPIVIEQEDSTPVPARFKGPPLVLSPPSSSTPRRRSESVRLAQPSSHIRNSVRSRASFDTSLSLGLQTPSQTLFLFPPSPTATTHTPSTMTLTSEPTGPIPFPPLSTPRISTFRHRGGRPRSFIGLASPPTPTVGFSKVDARGFFGI